MYKFDQTILPFDSSVMQKIEGVYLWIWNPSEKSPHIGLSIKGEYFSLQLNSKQERYPVSKLLKTIDRRKSAVLLLALNTEISELTVVNEFKRYTSCQKNDCSCTAPLFKLFEIEKAQAILFDLLESFEKKKSITHLYQSNVSADFEGIPAYTFADVQNNLLQLSN